MQCKYVNCNRPMHTSPPITNSPYKSPCRHLSLESGVADDSADLGGLGKGPGTLVAIGKGRLDVGAALDSDGVVVVVEDLAAEGLVDLAAEAELNRLEGADAVESLALALAVVGEGELLAKLDSLVGEDDADLLVVALARLDLVDGLNGGIDDGVLGGSGGRGGNGASGEESNEDVGELHFDWLVG
ncbi:hypothetical protein B0T16DRAFT_395683 [Cercophora newfieldiana]|uniref:Uncharacterized protein n=1 Tax=Cercophora newfieldiana TaxID=92897 RepID=A0AA39YNB8_9PEZI|nr:hypothetical protein B0T16DRAFT_395683 [Cercophora newfieldiana]